MRYDFETLPERRGMDSIAWDWIGTPEGPAGPKEGFDAIPMWVADMNFVCCPAIQEAIIRRTQHPAFGYYGISDEYYNAIIRWQMKRNGVTGLEQKHIGYENGVLGGVISALNVMCSRGDKVLLQTPCYVGFTHVLHNNGYEIIHNPLIRDEHGIWRLDYEDLERKIVEHGIKATIFCNPHNPCGRVWEPEEIRRAMEIFEKHGVDLVRPPAGRAQAYADAVRQRLRPGAYRRVLRPVEDLQPGRPGGQLPYHLRGLAPGPAGKGSFPERI